MKNKTCINCCGKGECYNSYDYMECHYCEGKGFMVDHDNSAKNFKQVIIADTFRAKNEVLFTSSNFHVSRLREQVIALRHNGYKNVRLIFSDNYSPSFVGEGINREMAYSPSESDSIITETRTMKQLEKELLNQGSLLPLQTI